MSHLCREDGTDGMGRRITSMSQTDYFKVTGLVFLLVGALHLWRAFQGWELVLGSWSIPVWVSWVVGVVLIFLAGNGFWYAKLRKY